MNKNNELFIFIPIRYVFYSQIATGVLANMVLLLLHVLTFLLEHRLKPTDLPTSHLAFIHVVLQLTVGFIATDIFASQSFWNGLTCKSVILHRLRGGLSISTTCLLSVLQAVPSAPEPPVWPCSNINPQMTSRVFFSSYGSSISIGGHFLTSTVATPNVTSASLLFVTKSCSLCLMSYNLSFTFFTLATFRDVSLLGLVVLSSGYTVGLLCGHKRRSQHLHSKKLSPRASPEERAAQTILLLKSFFAFMDFWDCFISSPSGLSWSNSPVHLCLHMLVGSSFATVRPLVLIRTERRVIKFLKHMWGKDKKCLIIQR